MRLSGKTKMALRVLKELALFLLVGIPLTVCISWLWRPLALAYPALLQRSLVPAAILGCVSLATAFISKSEARALLRRSILPGLVVLVAGWSLLVLFFIIASTYPDGGDGGVGVVIVLAALGLGTPAVALAWVAIRYCGVTSVVALRRIFQRSAALEYTSPLWKGTCLGTAAIFLFYSWWTVHSYEIQRQLWMEAGSESTPPERLTEIFAKYGSRPEVAYAISRNPATPATLLSRMVSDHHPATGGVLMYPGAL